MRPPSMPIATTATMTARGTTSQTVTDPRRGSRQARGRNTTDPPEIPGLGPANGAAGRPSERHGVLRRAPQGKRSGQDQPGGPLVGDRAPDLVGHGVPRHGPSHGLLTRRVPVLDLAGEAVDPLE